MEGEVGRGGGWCRRVADEEGRWWRGRLAEGEADARGRLMEGEVDARGRLAEGEAGGTDMRERCISFLSSILFRPV